MPKPELVFYCPNHGGPVKVQPGWGHCRQCLLNLCGWSQDDLELTAFQKMVVMELADGGRLERYESYNEVFFQTLVVSDRAGYWASHHPSYNARLRSITIPRHAFRLLKDGGWLLDLGPRMKGSKTSYWGLTDKASNFAQRALIADGEVGRA